MSSPLLTQDSEAKQGPRITPVILCGGTGTRLWPLSRATYPKLYWALHGGSDATLPLQTHQRLKAMVAA